MYTTITKDIEFDRFGDISFIGNDISTISNERDIIYQNAVDRLISNFSDYKNNEDFGANISSYIGKKAHVVGPEIEDSIVHALTHDGFLSKSNINIMHIVDIDTIHIRIDIIYGQISLYETIRINSTFNTSSGLFHVTN